MTLSTRLFLPSSNTTMVFGLTLSKNAKGRHSYQSGTPRSGSGHRQDSPPSDGQEAKRPSKHHRPRRHGGDSTPNTPYKYTVPYDKRIAERDNPEETDSWTSGATTYKDLVPTTKEVALTNKIPAIRPSTSRTSTSNELVFARKEVAHTKTGSRNPLRTKHDEQRQIEHSKNIKYDRSSGWTRSCKQATDSSKSGKGLSAEPSSVVRRRTPSSDAKDISVWVNQVQEETPDDQVSIEDRISEVNEPESDFADDATAVDESPEALDSAGDSASEEDGESDEEEDEEEEPPSIKPTTTCRVPMNSAGNYTRRFPDSTIVGHPQGKRGVYQRPPMTLVNKPLGYR